MFPPPADVTRHRAEVDVLEIRLGALEILARVATRVSEPERAITVLEGILSRPGNGGMATGMPLTPALLRLDPMFDSLRSNARFQKLCAESTP